MIAGITCEAGVGADRGVEAARLAPRHTVQATVGWPLPPNDSDRPVTLDVVAALSRALAACGSVAFLHDDPVEAADLFEPPRKASIVNRVLAVAGLSTPAYGVVVATDPLAVAALFEYGGWSVAAQTALAFDPAVDPEPIISAVRSVVDWRARELPTGARLLFGPGHDGDFAILAAPERRWIDAFEASLQIQPAHVANE